MPPHQMRNTSKEQDTYFTLIEYIAALLNNNEKNFFHKLYFGDYSNYPCLLSKYLGTGSAKRNAACI